MRKYILAETEIWQVCQLLFSVNRWYPLGEIRRMCERLDVYYGDDVTRARLMKLVDQGKLQVRTTGGDYEWSLILVQGRLPGF